MEKPLISAFDVAFRQFGVGILLAAVFGYAVVRMYADLERKNEALLSVVREQSAASHDVALALRDLARSLDEQKSD